MVFDPEVVSLEDILLLYLQHAAGRGSRSGQYRSEIFPISEQQADEIRVLVEDTGVPLAEPGSDEALFWPAEDYHQKYRLRRNAELVAAMAQTLGPRWDEHVFATKLNAAGNNGFDVKPWLDQMPEPIVDAFLQRSAMASVGYEAVRSRSSVAVRAPSFFGASSHGLGLTSTLPRQGSRQRCIRRPRRSGTPGSDLRLPTAFPPNGRGFAGRNGGIAMRSSRRPSRGPFEGTQTRRRRRNPMKQKRTAT